MVRRTKQKPEPEPEEPARKETPVEPLLLTIKQVVALLQLGRAKVYSMMDSGELLSIHVGKSRLIPRKVVDEWLEHKIQEARAEYSKFDQPDKNRPRR